MRLDLLLVKLLIFLASDVWLRGVAVVGVDHDLAIHLKSILDTLNSLETIHKSPLIVARLVLLKLGVTSLLRALHEIVVALEELFRQFFEIL